MTGRFRQFCISFASLTILMLLITELSAAGRFKGVRNGSKVLPYSKPWMVLLFGGGQSKCGAFLISRQPDRLDHVNDEGSSDIILTAAHCVTEDFRQKITAHDIVDLRASFGKHVTHIQEPHQLNVQIRKIITHPKYDHISSANDIAIIQLVMSVKFGHFIKPIPLMPENLTLDDQWQCSLSGWGIGGRLSTVHYGRFSQIDSTIRLEPYIGNTTAGDSGSPVICSKANQSYAFGVHSMMNIMTFTNYAISIGSQIPWIRKVLHSIPEQENRDYHPNLYPYSVERNFDWPMWKALLEFRLLGLFGESSHALDVNLGQIGLEKDFSLTHIYKTLQLRPGYFCLQNIIGYYNVKDVYECVSQCYSSKITLCNFLLSSKRCYFLNSNFQFEFCENFGNTRSVVISFDGHSEKTNSTVVHHHVETASMLHELEASIEVPVVSVKIPLGLYDVHCKGALNSSDGNFYDEIIVSKDCIEILSTIHFTRGSFHVEWVLDEQTAGDQKFSFFKYYDGEVAVAKLGTKINLSNVSSHQFGQLSSYPEIKSYYPSEGAFLSKPFSTPWVVDIGRGLCTGVLLNETEFANISHYDVSRFVLTTRECLQKSDKLAAGSYFPHLKGKYGQSATVSRQWVQNDTQNARDALALVLLNEPFLFNKNIKPIKLHSGKKPGTSFDEIFIARASSIYMGSYYHYGMPMHEIPVEINYDFSNDTASLNKIYKKRTKTFMGRNFFYEPESVPLQYFQARISDPVIVCSDERSHCQLLGFACQSKAEDGVIKEFSIATEFFFEWVKETISSYYDI